MPFGVLSFCVCYFHWFSFNEMSHLTCFLSHFLLKCSLANLIKLFSFLHYLVYIIDYYVYTLCFLLYHLKCN